MRTTKEERERWKARWPRRKIARLIDHVEALEAQRDEVVLALEEIKLEEGRVCDDYEDQCGHDSCASSYTAWAIADKALATLGTTEEEPCESEGSEE